MLNFITGSVPKVGVESNSTIDIFFSMILNFPNEEQISFAFLSKSIFNFFSELELCLLSAIHLFAIIEILCLFLFLSFSSFASSSSFFFYSIIFSLSFFASSSFSFIFSLFSISGLLLQSAFTLLQ